MEILDIAKTQISKDLTKNLKSSKKAMVKLIDFELKYDSIDWIENKTGYYAMVTLSFNSQQHKYLIDPFNAYEGSKADISFRNIRIFKLKN